MAIAAKVVQWAAAREPSGPARLPRSMVRVYGPPGTGKTYWLTEKTRELFSQGLRPERLGVVAFSRDAADNARQRLAEAAGLDSDTLSQVCGIHQVAFEQYRAQHPHAIKADDPKRGGIEGLFEELGIAWSRYADFSEDSDTDERVPPGNYALTVWDWMRQTGQSWEPSRLVETISQFPNGIPDEMDAWTAADVVAQVVPAYEAWKQELGRWDFTDLLEEALREAVSGGQRPRIDALLVDESQDMGRLIWSLCDAWSAGVRYVAFAGDPHQALYSFLGAHPDLFERHAGTAVHLEQSYRVTQAAVELGKNILARGEHDANFPWQGLAEAPSKGDGSHVYLARTNRLVDQRARELMADGEPFWRLMRGERSMKNPLGRVEARHTAALLRLGVGDRCIAAGDLAAILKTYVADAGADAGKWVERGTARKVTRLADDTLLSALDLESLGVTEAFRRAAAQSKPWPILGAMNYRLLNYYRAVFETHGLHGLTATPLLTLSTVHRAKGREWDDAEICLNWGRRPYAALIGDDLEARQAEHRVLYVALTRSRRFPTFSGEDAPTAVEL